jgi:predicted permease
VPLDLSVRVDGQVLLYSFALSVLAGLLFGFVPAWIASRPMLSRALKGEDALARPGRRIFTLRNVLVVAQIAMSAVLLCATSLFLRSLENAIGIEVGFRSHGLLMVSVDPRVHGYTPEQTARFLDEARERIGTLPGVLGVAATDAMPLSGGHRSDGFTVKGRKTSGEPPSVEEYMASPGYFETLGIPRIAGRDFGNEKANAPKVAVVNRALAEQLFPGENPIGQRVTGGGAIYEIVGVVGNIKSRTLGEDTRPVLFRSLDQNIGSDPSFLGYTLVVRADGDMAPVANAVRQQIHQLDPSMAVYHAETIEEHLRGALFLPRLAGALFGVFGFIGLTLAVVGLYGVMSYAVSRREREMAIRVAVGAQLAAVKRLIVGWGMALTAAALFIGVPAAWMAMKFASSFVYGVRPHDPVTFILAPLFLAGVALIACWIPARRVARVNLQMLLRSE